MRLVERGSMFSSEKEGPPERGLQLLNNHYICLPLLPRTLILWNHVTPSHGDHSKRGDKVPDPTDYNFRLSLKQNPFTKTLGNET